MSTPSIAPGKWSVSPEWLTGTSEGFGAGSSEEPYYYYYLKAKKKTTVQSSELPSADWSQKATDKANLDLKAKAVLAETKRVWNIKEK